LTAEQKQARAQTIRSGRAAGKSWREIHQEVRQAVNLTDEQKAQLAGVKEQVAAVHKEFYEKLKDVLTAEQKELLKKWHEKRKEQTAGGK
jgi:Spy/CpxP family protein refolding chaperone